MHAEERGRASPQHRSSHRDGLEEASSGRTHHPRARCGPGLGELAVSVLAVVELAVSELDILELMVGELLASPRRAHLFELA